MNQDDVNLERLSISALIPYANNTRTHSEEQVAQIAASIKEFGFTNPILIDGENGIIAGHGRVLAARKLGIDLVPCIRLDHLSDTQKRAYIIADNKLALDAGWDMDSLIAELEFLQSVEFDLSLTGFDSLPELEDEIDLSLLDEASDADVTDGVKKAIMVDFELEHYEEAYELFKWWRAEGAYVGYIILDHLRKEKEKHEGS